MTRHPALPAILNALAQSPKTTPEISYATNIESKNLANTIRHLLRTEQISREEMSKGRWKYYIGQTAPKWTNYKPETRKQPKTIAHNMPVKRIEFSAECGRTNCVTLAAAPWEIRA